MQKCREIYGQSNDTTHDSPLKWLDNTFNPNHNHVNADPKQTSIHTTSRPLHHAAPKQIPVLYGKFTRVNISLWNNKSKRVAYATKYLRFMYLVTKLSVPEGKSVSFISVLQSQSRTAFMSPDPAKIFGKKVENL